MNWTVVQRILGLLLMMFSLTMLPPIAISLKFQDHSWMPFVQGFGLTLFAGRQEGRRGPRGRQRRSRAFALLST